VRGGVQLDPLGTTVTSRPIVPAPGWLWWWRNWWNDWQGKQKYSEKTCHTTALSTISPTCCPGANPGRCRGKPATNRLSYGTAKDLFTLGETLIYTWFLVQNKFPITTGLFSNMTKLRPGWINFLHNYNELNGQKEPGDYFRYVHQTSHFIAMVRSAEGPNKTSWVITP
jgi:hypothetical protein